jgi:hypothetical protein
MAGAAQGRRARQFSGTTARFAAGGVSRSGYFAKEHVRLLIRVGWRVAHAPLPGNAQPAGRSPTKGEL